MTCPRCQGLIVNVYEEEYCVNCGYRTSFVPPPSSVYRPLPEGFKDLPRVRMRTAPDYVQQYVTVAVRPPAPVKAGRRQGTPQERREKYRIYMRNYMREYRRYGRRIAAAGANAC